MRKRLFAAILASAMALALLPGTALAATETDVPYMKLGAAETCSAATVVEPGTTAWGADWYVVSGAVTIPTRITVTGNAHLILTDGAVLTANDGILLEGNNSLTVYAQSAGSGRLTASSSATDDHACIGGNYGGYDGGSGGNGGVLTVYGGVLTADGDDGVGVGGGDGGQGDGLSPHDGGNGGKGCTVTMWGGTLTAMSDSGVGMGGGDGGNGNGRAAGTGGAGGTVSIYGGTLIATSNSGAGMGGGRRGYDPGGGGSDGSNVTVNVYPPAGRGIVVKTGDGSGSGTSIPGSPFFREVTNIGYVNGPKQVEFTVTTTPISPAPGADVPKTGDSATPWLWTGLLLLAGAGLFASGALRRRKWRSEN